MLCFECVLSSLISGLVLGLGFFGSLFVGNMVLLICSVSVVLYSAGSGVKSVIVVLDALRVS